MTKEEQLRNSKGQIYYGMHFYPGVARYEPADKEPFTVYLNENVIREMGPSFAGRPIFVQHVEDVEENLDELRGEADGWVIESFFNEADGKHWVKFILTSEQGIQAAKEGWKLSNAYIPECLDEPGTWNGVHYDRKVVGGEFEHLAIVQNPRYEESKIMSPEQFKNYNKKNTVELTRLANSKDNKGDRKMPKFNLFKRQKIENAPDLDGVIVELPKSKKEVLVSKAIEEYDKLMNMNGYANGDHMVKVGDKDEMSVNDLVKKHMEMCNEFDAMKAKNAATEDGGEPGPDDEDDPAVENDDQDVAEGQREVGDRGGDEHLGNEDDEMDEDDAVENDDDEDEKEKKKDKGVKNSKEKLRLANAKKAAIKAKAERLKNAHLREPDEEAAVIDLAQDQVARGKSLYGSGI